MPLANPVRGELAFSNGDGEFILCYSINALSALKGALDMGVAELVGLLNSGTIEPDTLRTLFWAGLCDHQPDMDEREAGRLIAAGLVPGLVGEAMTLAFPSREVAEQGAANPRRRAGTLKPSGARGSS